MSDKKELNEQELKTVAGGNPTILPEGWTILDGYGYLGDYSCGDSSITPTFPGFPLACGYCPNFDSVSVDGKVYTVCKAGKTPSMIEHEYKTF